VTDDKELAEFVWQLDRRMGQYREWARHAQRARVQGVRHHDYARARAAAEVWERDLDRRLQHLYPSHVLKPLDVSRSNLEALRRQAVDLAAVEPVIEIVWLSPDSTSRDLVGLGNAAAVIGRRRAIVAEPIVDSHTAATVLHELGHHRDPNVLHSPPLTREVFAWRWAREHALVWDAGAQACMVEALQSYIKAADRRDLLDVVAAEEFVRPIGFRQELVRRWTNDTKTWRERNPSQL